LRFVNNGDQCVFQRIPPSIPIQTLPVIPAQSRPVNPIRTRQPSNQSMPLNWPTHWPIETVSWTTPVNVSDGLEAVGHGYLSNLHNRPKAEAAVLKINAAKQTSHLPNYLFDTLTGADSMTLTICAAIASLIWSGNFFPVNDSYTQSPSAASRAMNRSRTGWSSRCSGAGEAQPSSTVSQAAAVAVLSLD